MAEKPMLNAASLLDLKAELLRKREALKQTKLQRGIYSDVVTSRLKRPAGEEKTKKGSADVTKVSTLTNEEELALKKSRSMLERKAMLYDKLRKGLVVPDAEQSERFLVNFEQKVLDDPNSPCTVPELVNLRKNMPQSQTEPSLTSTPNVRVIPTTSIPDNQATDLSTTPEETDSAGPVHYQNVRFGEVRDHGVGYFAFSQNEEERKKQLDALNALRQHTVEQRKTLEKKKRKQQLKLKVRLAKVRLRKNISTLEDEEDILDAEGHSEEEENEPDPPPMESTKSETGEEAKEIKVRPWDKGKDFSDLLPERKPTMKSNVNQWMENRRAERVSEFAPPQLYNPEKNIQWKDNKSQTLKQETDSSSEDASRIIGEKISLIKQQYS